MKLNSENFRAIIVGIVILLLIGGGVFVWYRYSLPEVDEDDGGIVNDYESADDSVDDDSGADNSVFDDELKDVYGEDFIGNCDFSKEVELKNTYKYGIFGDDEFDTLVCGYLEIRKEEVWGEMQKNAYLMITGFSDTGFIEALDAGIESGNVINKKIDGLYALNLGCIFNEEIVGITYDEDSGDYIDDEVREAISVSTHDDPVHLIFSFGYHDGVGCSCCNLAHRIRLY